MRRVCNKKYKFQLLFIFICMLQMAVGICFASQKSFLSFDELFAYGASNNRQGIMEFPLNEWKDESFFTDYVTPEEEAFDYGMCYQNQAAVAKPFLYNALVHTLSSFHPKQISIWDGLGINLVLMLGCTIILYFLACKLYKNQICGFLIGGCYAFSYGALNTMLCFQEYMLLTFVVLLYLLVHIKHWEQPEISKKRYIFLGVILLFGIITSYHFLIVALLLGIWYIVKMLSQKRWREAGEYLTTISIWLLIVIRLFPSMWEQSLYGIRESWGKLADYNMKEYAKTLLRMFDVISTQMFCGFLWWILGIIAILFFWNIIKQGSMLLEKFIVVFPVIFMAAGYFLIAAEGGAELVDCYMMPLFPVVFLLAVGLVYFLVGDIVKEWNQGNICALFSGIFLCIVAMFPVIQGAVPQYAFPEMKQHILLMQQYADRKAVYIDREFNWKEYYHIIQLLKELESFYAISYAQIVQWEIEADLEEVYQENEIIVFVGNSALDDEITDYIKNTVRADEMFFLEQYDRWTIYKAVRL